MNILMNERATARPKPERSLRDLAESKIIMQLSGVMQLHSEFLSHKLCITFICHLMQMENKLGVHTMIASK